MPLSRFGVNTHLWINPHYPPSSDQPSIERLISEAALIGYSGVRIEEGKQRDGEWVDALQESHLQKISESLSLHFTSASLEAEVKRVVSQITALRLKGCRRILVTEWPKGNGKQWNKPLRYRPEVSHKGMQALCHGLKQVVANTSAHGIHLLYHPQVGSYLQSEVEVATLLDEVELLELVYDPLHVTLAGENYLQFLDRFAPDITQVHCADITPEWRYPLRSDDSFLDLMRAKAFLLPGTGLFDYGQVMNRLNRNGFQGWYVIESLQPPDAGDSFSLARSTFASMRHMLLRSYLHCGIPLPFPGQCSLKAAESYIHRKLRNAYTQNHID